MGPTHLQRQLGMSALGRLPGGWSLFCLGVSKRPEMLQGKATALGMGTPGGREHSGTPWGEGSGVHLGVRG